VGAPEAITVKDRDVVLGLADGRQLSARLIAGADGARSFVREHAGIQSSDRAYGQSAVVANFACERAHANTACQWFQCGPVLALLPLRGSHVSMVWSLPAADAERISTLEPEVLCREVEAATHGVLGQLSLATAPRSYPLRRLSARRLVAPRIALVGDAGHVIHPLAGQGLNLGLQDVRALVAVLAQRGALRDPGDLRLLRRYERSRAEPILAMDTMVDGLYTLFGTHNRLAGRLRNAGLNLTDRIPVLKNLLIRQALH
jgi:ubiquinone biosynthesis UbiH/UbiF/VisC/COQ6 family hydroxylase